ncbi:MAG: glycosyltransferase [Candidatus Manganitrophus sp. SB1]|nr:glycosyltransferase [Candidatus Manganitrophus morganii]
MTIYNAAPFLKEAIDSIVTQTLTDWELIAVENGSSDESPTILAGYTDERIRVFSLPKNIGRTPALRYAFERAQGEYIAVLDADDVSYPERLAQQTEYLDQRPDVGLVGSWVEYINEKNVVTEKFKPPVEPGELYDLLGWMNPFVHSSIMYRARLGKDRGGYPERYVYAQDKALILNIAKVSQVAMIDEYLCRLRETALSITRSPEYSVTVATERLLLLKQTARDLSLSKKALKQNRLRQAAAQLKLGAALLRRWHILDGLKHILLGIVKDPSGLWNNGVTNRRLIS